MCCKLKMQRDKVTNLNFSCPSVSSGALRAKPVNISEEAFIASKSSKYDFSTWIFQKQISDINIDEHLELIRQVAKACQSFREFGSEGKGVMGKGDHIRLMFIYKLPFNFNLPKVTLSSKWLCLHPIQQEFYVWRSSFPPEKGYIVNLNFIQNSIIISISMYK